MLKSSTAWRSIANAAAMRNKLTEAQNAANAAQAQAKAARERSVVLNNDLETAV